MLYKEINKLRIVYLYWVGYCNYKIYSYFIFSDTTKYLLKGGVHRQDIGRENNIIIVKTK